MTVTSSVPVRAWLLAAGVLLLTGCPPNVELRLDTESAQIPVFLVRGGLFSHELPYLRIVTCESVYGGPDAVLWQVEPRDRPLAVERVEYGSTPEGYREVVPPQALEPNSCYVAICGGKSALYFSADAAGLVKSIQQSEAKEMVSR